jgi:hypothetical protein
MRARIIAEAALAFGFAAGLMAVLPRVVGDSFHMRLLSGCIAGFCAPFVNDLLLSDIQPPSFPKVWYLLKFLMSGHTRERVFMPAYHELVADHAESLVAQQHLGKWAQGWFRFCFTFRTLVLLLMCIAIGVRSAAAIALFALVPPGIKDAIRLWWYTTLR